MQPIVVRKDRCWWQATKSSPVSAASAQRNWQALTEVPVIVKEVDDKTALARADRNLQRQDLNAIEEAQGIQRLIAEFSFTHEQAAEAVGKSRSAVSKPVAPA